MVPPLLRFTPLLPSARRTILVLALLLSGAGTLRADDPPAGSRHEPASSATTQAGTLHAVLGVAITVADLDASVQWYASVLEASPLATGERSGDDFSRLTGMFGATDRWAQLQIGDELIELVEYLTPSGRPMPVDTRSNDRWFQHIAIIVRDMDEAFAQLRRHGVRLASSDPQRLPDWNPNAGGIRAFYFRDPDGHYLEILEFPAGKGEPRWQSDDRLFLGIDHTAIVVEDTDKALAFYQDLLGMSIAGTSENYGVEQEHLNAVFAARLRITALRAPTGPAVELLEYLTPRDGRPMPLDSRPSDVWHWQILGAVRDADSLFGACRRAGGWPVSPGAQDARSFHASNTRSLLARDPDGHAWLFIDAQLTE